MNDIPSGRAVELLNDLHVRAIADDFFRNRHALAAWSLAPDRSILSFRDIIAFADDHREDDPGRWESLQKAIVRLRPFAKRYRLPMVSALTAVSDAVWDLSGGEGWDYILGKWAGPDSREEECSRCSGSGRFVWPMRGEVDCPICYGVGLVRR